MGHSNSEEAKNLFSTILHRNLLFIFLGMVFFGKCLAVTEIDRAYVIVNDEVITQSEIERELQTAIYELRSRGEEIPSIEELRSEVVDDIVLQELQYQRSRTLGLTINDDEITSAINDIARRNELSMLELRREVERTGLSYEEYRHELTRQLLIHKVIEHEVGRYVRVHEADIKEYLSSNPISNDRIEYELSHVLIPVTDNEDNARSRAKDIYKRIISGVPFIVVVTELAGSGLTRDISNLGWKNSDQLPDLFLEAIRDLPVGGVSLPIQSKNGFHILRLNGKRGEGRYTVDQKRVRQILLVKDDINDEAEIIKRLLRIRQRVIAGEDFGGIARLQSSHMGSRALGGDLGWLDRNDLEPELESILASLSLGDISMPVKTKSGYHLLQVTNQRTQDIGDQLQREKARLSIRSDKLTQQYEIWKKNLFSKAWIDYRVTDED